MKHINNLIISLLLIIPLTINSQSIVKHQNTIEVNSTVKITKEITVYRTKVMLNFIEEGDYSSLEEFKETYLKKTQEKGFKIENFKENELEYLTMGYQKSGTLYTYETSSKEKFLSLLKTHINGIYYYDFEQKFIFNEKVYDKSLEKIIAKAKVRANKTAKKINRKIGKIIMIKDNTPLLENEWYPMPSKDHLNFDITFEML